MWPIGRDRQVEDELPHLVAEFIPYDIRSYNSIFQLLVHIETAYLENPQSRKLAEMYRFTMCMIKTYIYTNIRGERQGDTINI